MTTRRKRPKLPELFGRWECAQALGCSTANLDRQRGVPEPIAEVKATRLWLADEIREFVVERDKQREERREGRSDERE
jgi:hypothetical protein